MSLDPMYRVLPVFRGPGCRCYGLKSSGSAAPAFNRLGLPVADGVRSQGFAHWDPPDQLSAWTDETGHQEYIKKYINTQFLEGRSDLVRLTSPHEDKIRRGTRCAVSIL